MPAAIVAPSLIEEDRAARVGRERTLAGRADRHGVRFGEVGRHRVAAAALQVCDAGVTTTALASGRDG